MPTKPQIIHTLEQQLGLDIPAATATTLKDFMRYGQQAKDKAAYLLDGDTLIGLKLSTCGLAHTDFLQDAACHGLRALYLSENDITALHFPAEMTALEQLYLGDNAQLQSLTFGGAMPRLRSLDASDSGLKALVLHDCPRLEKLDISRNQLKRFAFASPCPQLNWLDLSGNKTLKKLLLPAGMEALNFLYLRNNGLEELEIKGALPSLRVLDLENNHIRQLPADVILDAPLDALYVNGNRPKNIPWLFLENNDLEEVRTWFEELRDAPHEPNKVVKLMISGNGNVGKTTLMCALQSETGRCNCPDDQHGTTHGIQLGTWETDEVEYKYWDFGGQEVYHGTHQLFMASDAVQLIVFDEKTEAAAWKGEKVGDRGKQERKITAHPVPYWVETIKELSAYSEFVVLQNKIAALPNEHKKVEDYVKKHELTKLEADAKAGLEIEDIPAVLKSKAALLPDFEMEMPSSWLAVRQFFIDNDNKHKEERQKHISQTYFDEVLCKDIRPKSKEYLTKFLHHGGYLYTHPKLGDQIIADQRWALDVIYQPFDRDAPYSDEFRKESEGKIRVRRLFEVFGEYKRDEKWLFLSFMESCGLCFKLLQRESEVEATSLSTLFVFPEFLPENGPVTEIATWKQKNNPVLLQYEMPWIDHKKLHAIICALGQKTSMSNIWRNGILVSPPEGKFLMEIDVPQKLLQIWIDKAAMADWCKAILDKFPDHYAWYRSDDGGQHFKPFDAEKWQEKHRAVRHDTEVEGQEARSLDKLPVVFNETTRETMLFFSANPRENAMISYQNEFTAINEELAQKGCLGKIEMVSKSNTNAYTLTDTIVDYDPHIIHFVGHGDHETPLVEDEAVLLLVSENGRSVERITARELEAKFKRLKGKQTFLKLVFLNACLTEAVAKAISRSGVAAIGTNAKIGSVTARRVAMAFYKHYALTKDIAQAVEYARNHETTEHSQIRLFQNGEEINL